MPNEVKVAPNVPLSLALLSPEGELDEQTGRVHYSCSDGRVLVVSALVARKIRALSLQPGESFGIRKDWSGEPGDPATWTVWLSPQTEKNRATAEDPNDLERKLVASIDQAQRRKARSLAPVADPVTDSEPEMVLGTGTTGPAVQRRPAAKASASASAGRIPYNIAFREVVKFVSQGLEESGQQWNDEARQGMVSTIIIAAAKQNLLAVWERP